MIPTGSNSGRVLGIQSFCFKSDHNAETTEEAEENIRGMNNQDNTENSKNTNTTQHVFSPVLLPRLKSAVQYKPNDETVGNSKFCSACLEYLYML